MRIVALGELISDARPGFASGEDVEDGVIQIRMNNVTTEGTFDWSKVRRVPVPKRFNDFLVEQDDILFNATNSPDLVGKNAVFRGFSEPVTFSNHFIRIRLNDRLADSRLVSRWLTDQWRRGKFRSMCRQWVNQASINKDQLLSLDLVLPPLDEQRRIAAILDQADDLRRGRREALARLEGLAEAAFAEMFGVASRLTETHLSRLGEYLNFITSGGRNWAEYYSPVGHRFIRSFDVQMNHIGDEDIVFVDPPNNAEALRTRTQAGDVVLTITGSRIGRVATIPEELAGSYISQHVAILRVKSEMMIPHYLSFFLSLRNGGQRLIAKAQYGQTKPGLNFEQIRDFRVPVPPMARQKAFLECVERIEATRRSELRHAAKLDALFASLQHRAFRGEL